jgi:hypothetical protein
MRGGYVAALILGVVSFIAMVAAGIVLLIVGAASGLGDSDKYGRVPVPGAAVLELPAGEASVYYEEHTNSRVRVPHGFEFSVLPVGGGPAVPVRDAGIFNERVTSGGTTRERYARIDVTAAGRYAVQVGVSGSAGREPAITLGESFTSKAFGRVKWAGLGLIGIALAALLAIGTFLWRRLSPEDERVTMPPQDE